MSGASAAPAAVGTPVCIAKLKGTMSRCGKSNELVCLSELQEKSIRLKNAGFISTAEAIKGRIGYFNKSDNELFICEGHRDAVTKNFRMGETCFTPPQIAKHKETDGKRKAYRSITYPETEMVFYEKNVLIPVGKGLCRNCVEEVGMIKVKRDKENREREQAKIDDAISKRREELGKELRPSTIHASLSSQSSQECESDDLEEEHECDPDFDLPPTEPVSSPEHQSQPLTEKEMQALQKLTQKIGLPQPRRLKKSIKDLSERMQREHINWRRQFDKAVDTILCPTAPQEYRDYLDKIETTKKNLANFICDGPQSELVKAIATAYLEANTTEDKRRHLSIIASALSFNEAQTLIPRLSKSAYKKARQHAFYVGVGAEKQVEKQVREKFSRLALEHFIGYISSSLVISDLPFGEKTLKLSSGELVLVPNVIRNFAPERIVKQYYTFFGEEKKSQPDVFWFKPLSRSAILRVLEVCKASQRKSLHGIDYTTAEGSAACDTLIDIVKTLEQNRQMPISKKELLMKEIKLAKNYLKSDFKAHVGLLSNTPDHCIQFALSDAKKASYSAPCDHDHMDVCNECIAIPKIFEEIRTILQNANNMQDIEKNIANERIDEAEKQIHLWKAHQLRMVNQDRARVTILQDLRPNKDLYLLQDWAMKMIPVRYHENTKQFFGKRGLPWHVTVACMRAEDGKLLARTFVHHFNQCKQNNEAVSAIMVDVLQKLKGEVPSLENAYFRSDNGACYHCAPLLLSIPAIGEKAGIKIKRMDFSDPQGGKGDCDRIAATVKRHINLYVAEKHDVTNTQQFFEAASSHNGIRGASFHSGTIMPPEKQISSKVAIPEISLLNNFRYDDNGITVWKAYNEGPGHVIQHEKLAQIKPENLTQFNETLGTTEPVQWRVLGEIEKENSRHSSSSSLESSDAETTDTAQPTKLFACPDDACLKNYRYQSHLDHHILAGNHVYEKTRRSMKDAAIVEYKHQISGNVIMQRAERILHSRTDGTAFDADKTQCNEGWALKHTKEIVRFTEKQKNFLTEKFLEGEESDKYTPEQVAQLMRKTIVNGEPLFAREEWLTQQQILSFFSRLTAKRQLESDLNTDEQTVASAESTASVADDDEINEEVSAFQEATLLQEIRSTVADSGYLDAEESTPAAAASVVVPVDGPTTTQARRSFRRNQPRQQSSSCKPKFQQQRRKADSSSSEEERHPEVSFRTSMKRSRCARESSNVARPPLQEQPQQCTPVHHSATAQQNERNTAVGKDKFLTKLRSLFAKETGEKDKPMAWNKWPKGHTSVRRTVSRPPKSPPIISADNEYCCVSDYLAAYEKTYCGFIQPECHNLLQEQDSKRMEENNKMHKAHQQIQSENVFQQLSFNNDTSVLSMEKEATCNRMIQDEPHHMFNTKLDDFNSERDHLFQQQLKNLPVESHTLQAIIDEDEKIAKRLYALQSETASILSRNNVQNEDEAIAKRLHDLQAETSSMLSRNNAYDHEERLTQQKPMEPCMTA